MYLFKDRIKGYLQHPIFKRTAIYTITDGITKSISFIVLPIVSYFIIPSELGIAANFDVLQNIVILLAGQVVVNSLPYFYYERTKEEVAILVSNLLFQVLLLNMIFAIIIVFCTNIIDGYLHIGLSLQLLTVLSSICMLANSVNFILYRMEDNPINFAKLQIGQVIVYVGLLIILVVGYEQQAFGKILSHVVAMFIMSFIHLSLLYKRGYLLFKVDLNIQKTLMKFGIPLLPHSLSFWIKGGMDKVILTTYCGLSVNGLYSMALSFGAVYALFNTSFNNVYVPELQKRLSKMTPENEYEEKKFLVKLSYKLGGAFFCVGPYRNFPMLVFGSLCFERAICCFFPICAMDNIVVYDIFILRVSYSISIYCEKNIRIRCSNIVRQWYSAFINFFIGENQLEPMV